jgi:hypothetical protein
MYISNQTTIKQHHEALHCTHSASPAYQGATQVTLCQGTLKSGSTRSKTFLGSELHGMGALNMKTSGAPCYM